MTETSSITPSNDKLWNILCHISPLLGFGLILPLIALLVTQKDATSTIPAHARETLNFHISLLIYAIVGGILTLLFIGILILLVLGIATVVLAIVGAVKASSDQVYHYPLTIRLVK